MRNFFFILKSLCGGKSANTPPTRFFHASQLLNLTFLKPLALVLLLLVVGVGQVWGTTLGTKTVSTTAATTLEDGDVVIMSDGTNYFSGTMTSVSNSKNWVQTTTTKADAFLLKVVGVYNNTTKSYKLQDYDGAKGYFKSTSNNQTVWDAQVSNATSFTSLVGVGDNIYKYNSSGGYRRYNNTNPGTVSLYKVSIVTGPSITTSESSLSDVGYSIANFSQQVKSFTVSGSNLTANVTVTAPTNYEVCKTSDGTYTSSVSFDKGSGTLSAQTVYVRLQSGKTAGNYSGNVACTSDGATTKNVAVSGSVPFTVTWKANGTTHATTYVAYATSPGTAIGSLPDAPDPSDYTCTPKTFYGWYDGDYSHASTAPTCITTATKITSDKTYNAVFATATPGDGSASVKSTGGFPVSFTTSNYSSGTSNGVGTATITANAGSATITLSNNATGIYFAQKASGAYWLFTIPVSSFSASDSITLALSGVKVSNTDYKFTYKFQYSTNGSSYTDFGSSYTETTTATAVTRGIKIGSSLLTGNIYIKILSISGGGTKGGNHYINSASITCHTISETTYSNYATSCCEALGQISGSVALSQLDTPDPTKLKAGWTMNAETGIASYTLEVYDSSNNLVKTINNYTSGSDITGLTPCTEYYVKLYTVSSGGSYCEGGLISTSESETTQGYNVTFPTLTGTTKLTGNETACASGNYVATFEAASEAYELPTTSGVTVTIGGSPATSGTDYTWAVSESVGTLTIPTAKQTGDITIAVVSIAHSCSATPILGAASLSGAFSLSSVGVSCANITPGSYCAVESGDYGFIWYEGDASDKKIGDAGVTKVAISTGDYSSGSFSTELNGTFVAGNTYTFRAFATNTGDNTGYSAESSFTPRSVTFNSNGGSDVATAYVNSGSAVSEPSAPTRTGYDFSGWQLSGAVYSFSSAVSANITLDAVWSAKNYTVTISKNYGSAATKEYTATYDADMPDMNDFAYFTRVGYTLLGIFANADGTGTQYYNADKSSAHIWDQATNATIYAAWSPKNYTIALNNEGADSGKEGTTSISVTYDANTNLTSAITKPVKDGYVFGGYYTGTDGSDKQIIDADGNVIAGVSGFTGATQQWIKADDVTLHAYWRPSYTVTWSVNGAETTEQVIKDEKVAALPTAPMSSDCDDAKKFVGWRAEAIDGVSASAPSGIFTTVAASPEITEDVTFYAVFADSNDGTATLTNDEISAAYCNGTGSCGNQTTYANGPYTITSDGGDWENAVCAINSNSIAIRADKASDNLGRPHLISPDYGATIKRITISATNGSNSARYIYICSSSSAAPHTDNIGAGTATNKATTNVVIEPTSSVTSFYVYVNDALTFNSITVEYGTPSNYVTRCASCDEAATFSNAAPTMSGIDCTAATVTATGGLATWGSEGCNISDYGFVLGTSENPTTDDTKLQVGTSNPVIGSDFSYDITDLTKGTQYYVRAYATNKFGTAYSNNVSFYTSGVSSIAITTAPAKTNYIVGETFDATGMVVTATMVSGNEVEVTEDVTYSTAALTAGTNQDFAINYSLCGEDVAAQQRINVYTLTVNEGTNADKGEASYTSGATFSVSDLAEHTTVGFDVTNGSVTPNGDGTYTVTPNGSGDVTVTVNYVTAVQVAVKYYINGVEQTELQQNPYQSEEFTLKTASDISSASLAGYPNFVGWSTTPFGYQTSEPTLAPTATQVMEPTNYYAVFTNLESVQIVPNDFNGTKANNEGEKTIDGVKYNIHEMCKQTDIQFSSGGYLYTIDAIRDIKKVEITGKDLPVYVCSNASGSVDGSAITSVGTAPYVYTFPANKQYLKITDRNGTSKVSLIKIYYAPEAVYYATEFKTLTFNKADGAVDKTEKVATGKTRTLSADDAPAAVAGYTFIEKWSDGANDYVAGDGVTVNEDMTLNPYSGLITDTDVDINALPATVTEIVVTDGKTLTVDADKTLDNLTVEAGGKVETTNELTVINNLTINSEAGKSGQVSNAGKVHANNVYIDVTFYKTAATLDATTANQWYMISAPFNVNLNGGFLQTNGTPMVFGTDFDLFEYDGAKRATTGVTGWKRVSGQMKAGTACLIGFNEGQSTTIRLKAANTAIGEASSITLNAYDGDPDNQNWNGVANPNLHYISLDKDVQYYDNDARGYNPGSKTGTSYVVGTAFFIQESGVATISNMVNTTLQAPRRAAQSQELEYCVRLAKEDANWANHIYIRASEEASAQYEQGHDMVTWNGTTAKTALLWTENYGMRLAIEEAPLLNNQASYALGLYVPANGTYRIEIANTQTDATLYLTQGGTIIWNLTDGAYEVDLTAGTTSEYGLLLQAGATQIPTGVEEVGASKAAQKVVIDDHVYILRGEKMYDTTGKMVK